MKRIFDILLLLVTAPIWLVILLLTGLAVRLTLGSPIFFTQLRGGYKGKPFGIWKFRSMTNARDAAGDLLPDAKRLTKFGSFLRATSLDELPCLWNLAKGDITLVGPRPFIADYLPLYSEHQRRRHDVVPGITGWAQVNGRNALSWEEKFDLDLWYVDNRSFSLDVKILLLTAAKVFARHGVSAEGDVTMPRFTGSKTLH
jgi:sugar transferase EpsL